MDKLNLNFSGGANVLKSICWIMSYISWIMLVITGWISMKWLADDKCWMIWTIRAVRDNDDFFKDYLKYEYYPFQMHIALIYVVFILSLLVILGGCIVFFVKSIFKKDDQVINGMMGEYSKFHFFPLLCASALFIMGEVYDNNLDTYLNAKDLSIAGLIFAILGLASMIFIYIMTDLNTSDWWVLLLLKKGTYSCLIVLMWYYFCYDIYYVHSYEKDNRASGTQKEIDWKKGCGLAFSIIFGIGSLAFSFVFKDLVASCINLLIYLGLTVLYFNLDKEERKKKEHNKNGDGIVDIIMLVLSVAMIVVLLVKFKEQCLKS